MELGRWKNFSDYRARYISCTYEHWILDLKIVDRRHPRRRRKYIIVYWTIGKHPDMKYSLAISGGSDFSWSKVFNSLRKELIYKTQPAALKVLQAMDKDLRPFHQGTKVRSR